MLIELLTVLSAALCGATMWGWVRTHSVQDEFTYAPAAGTGYTLTTAAPGSVRAAAVTNLFRLRAEYDREATTEWTRAAYRWGEFRYFFVERILSWSPVPPPFTVPPTLPNGTYVGGTVGSVTSENVLLSVVYEPDRRDRTLFGFSWDRLEGNRSIEATLPPQVVPYRIRRLTIPLWFPTLCFAAVPVFRLTRLVLRRRRRRVAGRCAVCGYDCRATPQRCPECGTAITRKAVG